MDKAFLSERAQYYDSKFQVVCAPEAAGVRLNVDGEMLTVPEVDENYIRRAGQLALGMEHREIFARESEPYGNREMTRDMREFGFVMGLPEVFPRICNYNIIHRAFQMGLLRFAVPASERRWEYGPLTSREAEHFALLARGFRSIEVAPRLGDSVTTTNVMRRMIRAKLRVPSTELAITAGHYVRLLDDTRVQRDYVI